MCVDFKIDNGMKVMDLWKSSTKLQALCLPYLEDSQGDSHKDLISYQLQPSKKVCWISFV